MQRIANSGHPDSVDTLESKRNQVAKIFTRSDSKDKNKWSKVNYDNVPKRLEHLQHKLNEMEDKCENVLNPREVDLDYLGRTAGAREAITQRISGLFSILS